MFEGHNQSFSLACLQTQLTAQLRSGELFLAENCETSGRIYFWKTKIDLCLYNLQTPWLPVEIKKLILRFAAFVTSATLFLASDDAGTIVK